MARILIVDDDMTTRLMIGALLGKAGHTPIFSPDGQHAYETLMTDNSIDLLVTDVMMPRVDGRQLIQMLRETEAYANLPVIVFSSVVGPREISTLLEMGVLRFLPKPLVLEDLLSSVKDALRTGYA